MNRERMLGLVHVLAVRSICVVQASDQFKDPGMAGGIGFGILIPQTNLSNDQTGSFAHGFLRFPLEK